MSLFRLARFFSPRSVALVGASPRPGSLGRVVLDNLRAGGFLGRIDLVNPRHTAIEGLACAPSVAALAQTPDIAIVAAPAASVPGIIQEAAARGVEGAIVITAGLGHGPGSGAEAIRLTARAVGLRIVGPNCLGLLAPRAKLNASFSAKGARAGDIALVSQSGAIAAALIEWADRHDAGFSGIVSLGDQIDADFGDFLDYFAEDRGTRAILLYIEAITDARKFMSAARAAARVKPVVVVKSGRHAVGAKAARSHTGALAGSDAVHDAAFRRAGLLRVIDLDELFTAAETLSRLTALPGERIGVLTNGGGLGVLAVDRLADLGGIPAELSAATLARLDAALPATWSRADPVDIIGDADAARYVTALEAMLDDPGSDAILVLSCPTGLAPSVEAARAVADTVMRRRAGGAAPKPVFAVWLGDMAAAGDIFAAAAIPHFGSEADAARGLMHLVEHRRAQTALMETPPSLPDGWHGDAAAARAILAPALASGRTWLDPVAVTGLLEAYAIPVAPARAARDAEEAVTAARPFLAAGQAVAVKIRSDDIVHKSDVGGVRLGLASEAAVREATAEMLARIAAARPTARLDGVTVQPMVTRTRARERIAGLADDATFGPVVVFGRGGTAVEVIDDKALALPPLDLGLAHDLMARTRVHRLLLGYRDVPPADRDAVALVLVKLAQMAVDLPEIRELDLNPILADETGVIVLDARVAIAPAPAAPAGRFANPRLAIRPYPREWERTLTLRGGREVFARPIRPEDERLYPAFLATIEPRDLRLRFFAPVKEFSHAFVARLTQIDYARAMAFVALEPDTGEFLGVVRLHADSAHQVGEYAVLVRSALKGHGLGWALMRLVIDFAAADGLATITGQVLRENTTMIAMCQDLGFTIAEDGSDRELVVVRLDMAGAAGRAPSGA